MSKEQAIDSLLGCHIPWQPNNNQQGERCSTESQFLSYVEITEKFASLDAIEMEKETGCRRRCSRMEYRAAIQGHENENNLGIVYFWALFEAYVVYRLQSPALGHFQGFAKR